MVDDDVTMHDILHEYYKDSALIEIKYDFTDSKEFMETAPHIDFDMCFLDICMPNMDGIVVAQLLRHKPFIFITGSEDRLKDALGLEPIDIVTKPFNKVRLDHAIEKAYNMIAGKIDYAVFSVAECQRKVKIQLSDILYASTDDIDPRHKPIVLRDGKKFTLMNCSMEQLISFAPHLMQVNKKELVSIDMVNEIAYDLVSVNSGAPLSIPRELTLSRAFKEQVSKRIFFV